MARYIKANRLVAEFLHLENDRNKLNDGNYLLWQQDMLEFGPLPQLNETLVMIGGLALLPHEAREEQDGVISRPLPIATDPRFILPDPTPEPEPEPEENNGESQGENSEQVEQPGESQEAGEQEEQPANGEGETTEAPGEGENTEQTGESQEAGEQPANTEAEGEGETTDQPGEENEQTNE